MGLQWVRNCLPWLIVANNGLILVDTGSYYLVMANDTSQQWLEWVKNGLIMDYIDTKPFLT